MSQNVPPVITPAQMEEERQLRLSIIEQQHGDAADANAMANRPGFATTEFWLAAFVAISGELSAAYSTQPWAQVLGHVAAALAAIGYGFSRAKIKAAP